MFSKTLFKKYALPVVALFALSITACEESDDTNPDDSTLEHPFVVSMAVQGSDNTFTYYTVPFEDVMTGSLSALGEGIEQPGYYDFTQIDETIFSIGGLDDVNVVGINYSGGKLTQIGDVSFTNSISDIVEADDNSLVAVEMSSDSDVVTFHRVDLNSVSVIETVNNPTSDLTDELGTSYAGMRVSNGHLYLAYYVSSPDTWETPFTDQAEVAVYSYPEFEFEGIMTDDRVGPIGGFNVKSGLISDENGDVYAVSHTNPANGYSQSTQPAGILKINAGETEFDEDYFLSFDELTEGKTAAHLVYLGNGKAFAEFNMDAREEQARWSDGPLQSAIIDLNNQTVEFITDIPQHAGDGRRLALLQDGNTLYRCIPEDNGIYIYKIDLNTLTATKGALVEANFVAGIFRF
ncbi:DUF4374 domain-containing protein [Roseivirga pacifica]|uniref:DUF4374 domain-containing protein n=1 Tax=Roseivirga pacifica TaxID=1267423 RepID=UPI00227B03AE|nr:DUF4374 domain-containing protein [Roseivirga pacifica]